MTSKESLFSLELVVDEIFIHNKVSCRFPAVAFRLLDFPTIVINHVEEEIADGMKKKIALDSLYELPLQFPELKNRFGKFAVKKGKSCLYKISADTLRSHLETAPVYVMVLDTYETVAKLVANCTVPLSKTIEDIYNDIVANGITVPSVHGLKETYKLYSLIGNEVGHVTLAHRLLSLGPGLLSHVPNSSIALPHQPEKTKAQAQITDRKLDNFVKQIVTNEDIIPVVMSGPDLLEKQTQTVQTETVAVQKGNQLRHEHTTMADDLLVTNVVCPPALFYNSKCPSPKWDYTLPVYRKPPKIYPGPGQDEIALDRDYSSSDIDTIEEPEIAGVDWPSKSERKMPSKEALKKSVMHSAHKLVNEIETRKSVLQSSGNNNQPEATPLQNILQMTTGNGNLPILSALLAELNLLTNVADPGHRLLAKELPVPKARKVDKPDAAEHHGQTNKENLKTFVKRMAVPKKKTEVHAHSNLTRSQKRLCEQSSSQVPPHRSWIRQTPVYSQRKTKLSYGLTNTQRLRLAKNNPELLKTIEGGNNKEEEIPVELLGQEVNFDNLANSLDEIAENSSAKEIAATKVARKPVPTPRSHSVEVLPRAPKSPVSLIEQASSRSSYTRSSYKSAKTEKSRSIEVHIPSVAYKDETLSQYSSALSDQEVDMTKTRVVNAPGFPVDDICDDDMSDKNVNNNAQLGKTTTVASASAKQKPKTAPRLSIANQPANVLPSNVESIPDSVDVNLQQYVEKYESSHEESDSTSSENESDQSEVTYHSVTSSASKKSSDNSRKSSTSPSASRHSDLGSGQSNDKKSERSDVVKSEHSQGSKAIIPPVNPVLSARSPVVSAGQRPPVTERRRLDSVDSIDTPRRVAKREAMQERRAKLQAMRERESFNTDSLSSYVPSDPDDIGLSGGSGFDQ